MFIRRKVRFMAKSQLFTGVMRWVYLQGGVFPVRRGARDEEAFITAEAILDRGGAVAMYPEGGRSRTGKLAALKNPSLRCTCVASRVPFSRRQRHFCCAGPVLGRIFHGAGRLHDSNLIFPKPLAEPIGRYRLGLVICPRMKSDRKMLQ